MTKEQIARLLNFYDEQIRNCEESLIQNKNKLHSETTKLYGEGNIRYKEGFRDALRMVTEHLQDLEKQA